MQRVVGVTLSVKEHSFQVSKSGIYVNPSDLYIGSRVHLLSITCIGPSSRRFWKNYKRHTSLMRFRLGFVAESPGWANELLREPYFRIREF